MISNNNSTKWSSSQLLLLYSSSFFILLFAISTSEVLFWLPYLREYTNPIFEKLVQYTGQSIFGLEKGFIYQITSDSKGLWVHLFNLLLISTTLGVLVTPMLATRIQADKVYYWIHTFLCYYIVLQLLLYGFNKVFKYQFFLPEPNTLYTTIGETPRDLLFWSLMGSAYGYTVFGGLLEVGAGLLLLFKKTRLLGGLVAIGLFTNVVAINFGFNISVKVYSSCYLLFSLLIVFPQAKRLHAFLIQDQWVPITTWRPTFLLKNHKIVYLATKTFVISLLLLESIYPYWEANSFNDDTQPRPTFHGAYDVGNFVQNGISYPALSAYNNRWKKVFVHRRGYWIIQYQDGRMQDYQFNWDSSHQLFALEHTHTQEQTLLQYKKTANGALELTGEMEGKSLQIFLSPLDWEKLPLLQNEFHWTIDEMK